MKTAPRPRPDLTAVTREIEPPADVLDAYAPGGFVFLDGDDAIVTRGTVVRLPLDDAEAVLRALHHDAPPGAPEPVAVGALPFHGAGTLAVPARTIRVRAGRAWCTDVGAVRDEPVVVEDREPARFVVRSHTTSEEWREQVEHVLAAIAGGTVVKVVLARDIVVEANEPFDVRRVLARLRATQGGCFVFGDGGFVGASPELLVRRRGLRVESSPMAGTVPRGARAGDDDATVAALRSSEKDAREHRVVVDAVAGALRRHCTRLDVPDRPDVVRLPTVAHLATSITGTLAHGATALDLARALHPTPAVNGTPTDAARSLIESLERFDRGRYAGPVGWVDAAGDGAFALALRCGEVEGPRARCFAGAGIVAESDPHAEWIETQAKLEPMLRALVRP